jgi:5-methylcytosine-specific restriction protein A
MSAIPTRSRELVIQRERSLCAGCRTHGSAWHHRRGRSVKDAHQHCPCNGVWLCVTCHTWAHANPFLARSRGWIVARYVTEPGTVSMSTYYGQVHPDCEGGFLYAEDGEPA